LDDRKGIRPVKTDYWYSGGGGGSERLKSSNFRQPNYLLLQYNQEWFDMLVLAHPACPGILVIKQGRVCIYIIMPRP